MEINVDQIQPSPLPNSLQQDYQEALLKSGIQAAKLISELMALSIMPDPRAKEMADVALEVIRLINSTPLISQPVAGCFEDSEPSDVGSSTSQDPSALENASTEVGSLASPATMDLTGKQE